MSRGINKVILIGNLGADPDVRFTQNQRQIANVSIATSDGWTDQNGQRQERTEWHRVVFFGRLAEIVAQYLRKGSKVYVEGRLQTRKWQNQQGIDQYTTEIIANEMQMLDSRGGGPADQGGYGGNSMGGYSPQPQGNWNQGQGQQNWQQPAQQSNSWDNNQQNWQQPAAQPPAQQAQGNNWGNNQQQNWQQPAPITQQGGWDNNQQSGYAASDMGLQPASSLQQPATSAPASTGATSQPASSSNSASSSSAIDNFDDFDDEIPF